MVDGRVEIPLESNGCAGTANEVRYLEHVQAIVSLTALRRGDIDVALISPGGTRSTLLGRRSQDMSADGFSNWAFMTTHSWGEAADGLWRLEIRNGARVYFQAKLIRWTLVLYGTDKQPYSLATLVKPLSGSRGHSSLQHSAQSSRDHFHHSPPDVPKNWSGGGRGGTPSYPINKAGVRSNIEPGARDFETQDSATQHSLAARFSPAFTQCLILGLLAATVSMTTFGCRVT